MAPDTVPAGWRTFGETPSMIEIYSEVLGVNYPWPKYSQAIIPDFTYGGMENVSATTQTDLVLHGAEGEPEDNGRGLAAHELAHQWFGDLTTTATWSHAWLNEGLTTYMESVQNEKSRGWSAGQRSWYRPAAGGDGRGPQPGAPAGLGRHRRRPDPALLQRPHLSQGRPGGPPAAAPAGRLALLGGDAPLPDRQRLQAGPHRGLRHRLRADRQHAISTGSSTSGATASDTRRSR